MCILVLCHFNALRDHTEVSHVSVRLADFVDQARVDCRPIGFLQYRDSAGFDRMGIRIGRYEPLFNNPLCGSVLPDGLMEFVARHMHGSVQLAGVAPWQTFQRLFEIFTRSDVPTILDSNVSVMVTDPADSAAQSGSSAFQLNEYDPRSFRGAASRKNQSARWPRV